MYGEYLVDILADGVYILDERGGVHVSAYDIASQADQFWER